MFHYQKFITTVDCINRQKEVNIDSFLPLAPFCVASVLSLEQQKADHVAITFLSDRTMRRMHVKYYNDPSSTDCMSFPIDQDPTDLVGQRLLGDMFICPRVAKQAALREQTSINHELALYTIHAALHLLGYDDITKSDRHIMRQKEQAALQLLEQIQQHGTI